MSIHESESAPASSKLPPLNEFVRRDLAYLSGVRPDRLAELDKRPYHERSAHHRQLTTYADQATRAFKCWVATEAPEAIPALRAAGLAIFTPEDGFGDGDVPRLVVPRPAERT